MSFLPAQPYSRAILQPISVPTAALGREHQLLQSSSTCKATTWNGTVHSFLGAGNRVVSSIWPPEKFNQSPADIPDDSIYNKHYDADSARPNKEQGLFCMYQSADEQATNRLTQIAPPRIVAKRYLPLAQPELNVTGKPALTLLMLTGMGLPKEVNYANLGSSMIVSTHIDIPGV